ncbi:MAG: competence protein CoiA family protein [Sulfuritalea sp.]
MDIQIPFGLRGDDLLHISEVDRGRDCNCICPECKKPLVARKGLIREPHFAHSASNDTDFCGGGLETSLHKYAKRIIDDARYLQLPGFVAQLPFRYVGAAAVIEPKRIEFSRVTTEEQMIFGRRRVDVVGYWPEGRLLIEIHVTHRVRGKKLTEVRQSDEYMLEIDVPRDMLFSSVSHGGGSLRELILDGIENKRWIHHPEGEKIREKLRREADPRPLKLGEADSEIRPLPVRHVESPIRSSGGHVPSRYDWSPEDYVRNLYQFSSGIAATDEMKNRMILALYMAGNITDQDIALSETLGCSLRSLVDAALQH